MCYAYFTKIKDIFYKRAIEEKIMFLLSLCLGNIKLISMSHNKNYTFVLKKKKLKETAFHLCPEDFWNSFFYVLWYSPVFCPANPLPWIPQILIPVFLNHWDGHVLGCTSQGHSLENAPRKKVKAVTGLRSFVFYFSKVSHELLY